MNTNFHETDPKVLLSDALEKYEYNQARLGRAIGIGRAGVHSWCKHGYKYLPPLYGWRFRDIHPEVPNT